MAKNMPKLDQNFSCSNLIQFKCYSLFFVLSDINFVICKNDTLCPKFKKSSRQDDSALLRFYRKTIVALFESAIKIGCFKTSRSNFFRQNRPKFFQIAFRFASGWLRWRLSFPVAVRLTMNVIRTTEENANDRRMQNECVHVKYCSHKDIIKVYIFHILYA